jgi:RNA-binding protein YlmH
MTARHKQDIYAHFHPDEHRFVDQAQEWIDKVAQHYIVKRTDFLDPRQSFILHTLLNRQDDVQGRLDGGYVTAERKRAILAPLYVALEQEDVGIHVLAVTTGQGKFVNLEHRDFLGAILGLGLKRDKIGDIHLHEHGCHYMVTEEASNYLELHLSQISKYEVSTRRIPLDALQVATVQYSEQQLSVASMRLDGIASDVYQLSRAQILQPIKAKKCRVNWRIIEDPSYPLQALDVVSLQGYGRFTILEVEGVSKKGRLRMRIGKHR